MPFKNTPVRYGHIAVTLHWLMAILIIGMLTLGLYMTDLQASMEKLKLVGIHKSFGVMVLILVFIRLSWRISSFIPKLPDNLAHWQKMAAHGMHAALYLLMFAMPLTGWLMSSAAGFPVSFFGLFNLPNLVAANPALKSTFFTLHQIFAYMLIALICMHIGAALRHHFLLKDNILKRMLPW